MAEQMSIQCSKRPPIKFPNTLVSFGKTNSVLMVIDSLGVFAFIIYCVRAKIANQQMDYFCKVRSYEF